MTSFRPVDSNARFPAEEETVLALWEKTRAFQRSVEERPADDHSLHV